MNFGSPSYFLSINFHNVMLQSGTVAERLRRELQRRAARGMPNVPTGGEADH
jgi:hypothetical protein